MSDSIKELFELLEGMMEDNDHVCPFDQFKPYFHDLVHRVILNHFMEGKKKATGSMYVVDRGDNRESYVLMFAAGNKQEITEIKAKVRAVLDEYHPTKEVQKH